MESKTKFRLWLFGTIIAFVIILLLWLRARQQSLIALAQPANSLNLAQQNYPAARYTIMIPDDVSARALEIPPLILNLVQHPIQFFIQLSNYIVQSPSIDLGDFLVQFNQYLVPTKDIKPMISANPPRATIPSDCGCTGNPMDAAKALF